MKASTLIFYKFPVKFFKKIDRRYFNTRARKAAALNAVSTFFLGGGAACYFGAFFLTTGDAKAGFLYIFAGIFLAFIGGWLSVEAAGCRTDPRFELP